MQEINHRATLISASLGSRYILELHKSFLPNTPVCGPDISNSIFFAHYDHQNPSLAHPNQELKFRSGRSTFLHVRANGRCCISQCSHCPVFYSLFLRKRVKIRKTGKLKGLKLSSSSSSYPFRRLKGSQLRNPTLTDRQTDADDYCNPLAHAR